MKLFIIGLGKVGKTLLRAYLTVENTTIYVYDRDRTKVLNAADNKRVFPVYGIDECTEADTVFITVIDKKILSAMDSISGTVSGNIVIMSGTINIEDAVDHIKNKNNLIIMHPIQTFIDSEGGRELFKNIYFSVEYTQSVKFCDEFCDEFDCHYIIAEKDFNRILYHAACMFASNFIVIMAKTADELLSNAHLTDGDDSHILIPIMEKTLENIKAKGIKKSLTGPVMRGDWKVIEKHISQIADSDTEQLYRMLIKKNIELVKDHDISNLDEMESIIDE
ncbi:MAG: Rossmann-like and DUF2520 domain-containing protein [candidate division WOR-3 bacterium]|nr:Rossmann-like and DUF2520 domain-containing protein [candidate division WOR-3 bacterium]